MLGTTLARATDAPGGGWHWGAEAHHAQLPRGNRVAVGQVAPLEEILYGPAPVAEGTANLVGALRRSMATTGYSDLKEFQRVEVVVAPYQRSTEQSGRRRPERERTMVTTRIHLQPGRVVFVAARARPNVRTRSRR